MTSKTLLFDGLAAMKAVFGSRGYREFACRFLPDLLPDWQHKHNNPILMRVRRGETTFEDAFRPLAEVNLGIDLEEGTGESFDRIAAEAEAAFADILSLGSLTYPLEGTRKRLNLAIRKLIIIYGLGGLGMAFLVYALASPGYKAAIIGMLFVLILAVSIFVSWFVVKAAKDMHRARQEEVSAVLKKVIALDHLVHPNFA